VDGDYSQRKFISENGAWRKAWGNQTYGKPRTMLLDEKEARTRAK